MILTTTFATALKFAAHAASKKDIRYYLMGVLFQFRGKSLHLVGTNGSSLAAVTLELSEAVPYEADLVIPNDALLTILHASKKDTGSTSFHLALSSEPKSQPVLTIEMAGQRITPKPIQGMFPDWRRVVPPADRPNNPMPTIDTTLLGAACDAIAPLVHKTSPSTRPLNLNAGPMVDGASFVAIRPAVMTMHAVTECVVVIGSIRA